MTPRTAGAGVYMGLIPPYISSVGLKHAIIPIHTLHLVIESRYYAIFPVLRPEAAGS